MATRNRNSRKACRPVPTDLPQYIVDRDHIALDAGLTIERTWGGYCFDGLISIYRGSYLQLTQSAFISDKIGLRIPQNPRTCVKRGVVEPWTPNRRSLVGAFRSEDGTYYVKFEDSLPSKWGQLEAGTQYFLFNDYVRVVYRGTKESLLQDAVVSEDAILAGSALSDHEDDYDEEVVREEGSVFTLSRIRRLKSGLYEFTKNTADEERLKSIRAEKAEGRMKPLYTSEQQYREALADVARLSLNMLTRHMREQSGHAVEYHLDEAVVDGVLNLFSKVDEAISCSPVRVKRAPLKEPTPGCQPQALADSPAFQRFIGKLLPP